MKATLFKPSQLSTIHFESSTLVIFTDDIALGDGPLLQAILCERNQALLNIPDLPSVPYLLTEGSNFRRLIERYYPGPFEILSGLQVHKFNKNLSIKWDPEGQNRLVAHVMLDDIYVTPPGGERVLVPSKSMYDFPGEIWIGS
jgi:hypothetical protein